MFKEKEDSEAKVKQWILVEILLRIDVNLREDERMKKIKESEGGGGGRMKLKEFVN